MTQHSGYIGIIGRPNVGKSTLLNRLIGQKLSITSRKPQTTRHQFIGIKTINNYQFLFVDTPGIHSNIRNKMNQYMNQTAKSSVTGVDVVLFLVDGLKWTTEDEKITDFLRNVDAPIILVVNKIDKLDDKKLLLPFIKEHTKSLNFNEIIPVSALKGVGIDTLQNILKKYINEAPHLYDSDEITTQSSKFIAGERIREKLMRRLGEELPYDSTVIIEVFEQSDTIIKIAATIWVSRSNQKGIVIGKGGNMLKSIGTDARLELETVFNQKVFLKLWVKVREGWSDDIKALNSFGYDNSYN